MILTLLLSQENRNIKIGLKKDKGMRKVKKLTETARQISKNAKLKKKT